MGDDDEKIPDSKEANPATSTEDTSTVFVKEETPDEKYDSIKTWATNLEAAGPSSKPEIKDEPVDDVKETKPTPTKDPLAEAMNELTGGLEEKDTSIADMDGASALAALASAAAEADAKSGKKTISVSAPGNTSDSK